jgi:hypothetical protein
MHLNGKITRAAALQRNPLFPRTDLRLAGGETTGTKSQTRRVEGAGPDFASIESTMFHAEIALSAPVLRPCRGARMGTHTGGFTALISSRTCGAQEGTRNAAYFKSTTA